MHTQVLMGTLGWRGHKHAAELARLPGKFLFREQKLLFPQGSSRKHQLSSTSELQRQLLTWAPPESGVLVTDRSRAVESEGNEQKLLRRKMSTCTPTCMCFCVSSIGQVGEHQAKAAWALRCLHPQRPPRTLKPIKSQSL